MIATRDSRASSATGANVMTQGMEGEEWRPAKATDGPPNVGMHNTVCNTTLSTMARH
jgi:hypothetical protein